MAQNLRKGRHLCREKYRLSTCMETSGRSRLLFKEERSRNLCRMKKFLEIGGKNLEVETEMAALESNLYQVEINIQSIDGSDIGLVENRCFSSF